jgi:mannose-1-phosphate guanylyltransferase
MVAKAAVLCGGRGERLRPLTDYFQKTMIPIGAKRRPLLEYIIRLLVYHNVRDIVLLTGYKGEEIERYFEDGSKFGARLTYSQDAEEMSGSANAVANALLTKKVGECDTLVVYYGDIISDLNVTELVRRHRTMKADATLVLDNRYTLPVGVAKVKKDWVASFEEKPSYEMSVTTGNMAVGARGLELITEMSREGKKRKKNNDLMTDFIPRLLKTKGRVGAYYTTGFWHDIGTVASYEQLSQERVDEKLRFLERNR